MGGGAGGGGGQRKRAGGSSGKGQRKAGRGSNCAPAEGAHCCAHGHPHCQPRHATPTTPTQQAGGCGVIWMSFDVATGWLMRARQGTVC